MAEQVYWDDIKEGDEIPRLLKNCSTRQLVHDWVGDKGRVKRFSCQYRGMDYTAQDVVCRGVVTKKYAEGGDHLVDVDIWTETGPAGANRRPRPPPGGGRGA